MNNQNKITLTGEVKLIQEPFEGMTAKGKYTRQVVLIEVQTGKFKNEVAINFWNNLVNTVKPGDNITVNISIECREKEGNYLNSLTAYHIQINN